MSPHLTHHVYCVKFLPGPLYYVGATTRWEGRHLDLMQAGLEPRVSGCRYNDAMLFCWTHDAVWASRYEYAARRFLATEFPGCLVMGGQQPYVPHRRLRATGDVVWLTSKWPQAALDKYLPSYAL